MSALRKVLVVDDDPVVGKSFARVLSGKGYAVITAANGQEALDKLATESYDLVYTDIKMPGMSGLDVAEKVQAERPWTPVVIITGYGTDEQEARAKAAGVKSFLHKPLSPEMIEGSARDVLAAPVPVAEAPVVEAPVEAPAPKGSWLKNVVLFFASPFVALAYIIAMPFVGIGMLTYFAAKAAGKNATVAKVGRVLRNIGLLIAAPFIALAYVVLFPFVGLAMVIWMGGRALAMRAK